MHSDVARRCARVLLDTAMAEGDDPESLERLASGLEEFGVSFSDSAELRKALASPAIPRDRRARLAQAVGDRIAPGSWLGQFLSIMVAREHTAHLTETADAFRAALDAHRGIVDAEVVSARPLDERDRTDLREALRVAMAGTPRLHFREDPELLGGFVIRIGNRILDASVNRQLSRFEEKYGA